MRMLIAGGTSFVGHAIALAGVQRGHEVTVINRGRTPHELPDDVERLIGDREGDLSALGGRTFDATIDTIAYRPRDVTVLAEALDGRGGHHVQISSISAYGGDGTPGLTEETAQLWNDVGLDLDGPVTAATYGPLKAACERAALASFGADTLRVRPTYVIGARDATLRFPYWVARARRGGDIAVPGPRSNALQYVDARDLAEFTVTLTEASAGGGIHVAGPYPAPGYVETIERVVARVGPPGTRLVELDPHEVVSANIGAKFPLWSGPTIGPLMGIDSTKALGLGLQLRPLEESVDDVLAWWGDRDDPSWWLDPVTERALLTSA